MHRFDGGVFVVVVVIILVVYIYTFFWLYLIHYINSHLIYNINSFIVTVELIRWGTHKHIHAYTSQYIIQSNINLRFLIFTSIEWACVFVYEMSEYTFIWCEVRCASLQRSMYGFFSVFRLLLLFSQFRAWMATLQDVYLPHMLFTWTYTRTHSPICIEGKIGLSIYTISHFPRSLLSFSSPLALFFFYLIFFLSIRMTFHYSELSLVCIWIFMLFSSCN